MFAAATFGIKREFNGCDNSAVFILGVVFVLRHPSARQKRIRNVGIGHIDDCTCSFCLIGTSPRLLSLWR